MNILSITLYGFEALAGLSALGILFVKNFTRVDLSWTGFFIRLVLIGSEPWMSVHYGVVSLKDRAMSSAAARLREFIVEAEAAVTLEERHLLERFGADGVGPHAAPRRRKTSTRVPR